MKRYMKTAVLLLAITLCFSGCKGGSGSGGGENSSSETQAQETGEDITDKLKELEQPIADLEKRAEPLHKEGKLDEDKYNTVMSLKGYLAEIGNVGTRENMIKYNSLKTLIDEMTYALDAAEDPVKTDNTMALNSLMDCINEIEPTLNSARDRGVFPEDRLKTFNDYKAEVQGYIDGTREQGENLTERLDAIRSDITTMASQAEASNKTIDKLNARPVTVEDNTKLEELVSNYLELQNEVQGKVNSGELEESKLTELMTTGIKVAQVKEALRTGDVTDETRKTMTECNTELKAFAEGIGSDKAQDFQ